MITYTKQGKAQYSEDEVANELGISVDRLRLLIRERIMTGDDEAVQPAPVTYQPSDILLLKLLAANLEPAPAPSY